MELVVVKGSRNVKPLLFKLGIMLGALSFTSFLLSQLRSRFHHPHKNPPSGPHSEHCSKPAATGGGGLKDELRILKSEEAMGKIINETSTTTTTTRTTTTFLGVSPTSKSSGDEEGFLLLEFNDIVMKEFEATGLDAETSLKKSEAAEDAAAMEQEIRHLKSTVWSLSEREKSLELQLLEYYGLQEQASIVRELESRLKISSVEAKLSSLKIESLQSENRRLQEQLMFEHSKTSKELEAARSKIKLLKWKLKTDEEQMKEKIASLLHRISVLQEREKKHGRDEAEVEKKLKTLKDLEEEAANLKMVNSRLILESTTLKQKLEASHSLGSPVLDGPKAEDLKEIESLKQANDKLTKEIDQLQTDHCTDVEELVYLRWVNACLRYELRNHQAPPGKTVARHLSNNLSPKSEEKAKQLILEYAHSHGDEKSTGLVDFDSEDNSSTKTSVGESEDNSMGVSTTKHSNSRKTKFLQKLKKLVLGKEHRRDRVSSSVATTPPSSHNSERMASVSTCSYDDVIGRDPYGSFSSCMTEDFTLPSHIAGIEEQAVEKANRDSQRHSFSKPSLDIQRLRRFNPAEIKERKVEHCRSDVERAYESKRMVSGEENLIRLNQHNQLDSEHTDLPENVELKKFARVLKKSRPRLDRESSSVSN